MTKVRKIPTIFMGENYQQAIIRILSQFQHQWICPYLPHPFVLFFWLSLHMNELMIVNNCLSNDMFVPPSPLEMIVKYLLEGSSSAWCNLLRTLFSTNHRTISTISHLPFQPWMSQYFSWLMIVRFIATVSKLNYHETLVFRPNEPCQHWWMNSFSTVVQDIVLYFHKKTIICHSKWNWSSSGLIHYCWP